MITTYILQRSLLERFAKVRQTCFYLSYKRSKTLLIELVHDKQIATYLGTY